MHVNPSPSSVSNPVLNKSCPQTEAVFRRTSNGYARIYFLKSLMNAEMISAFFRHGHFRVDHAFDLPISIVQRLQLKEQRVPPGLYKLREYEDFFIIDFDPKRRSIGNSYAID